jgi:hypothetical protein
MKRVVTQPTFEEFRLAKLHVPSNKPKSIEEFPFEFELERRMVKELGSFAEGYGDPTTLTNILKSMEEVDVKVMKVD